MFYLILTILIMILALFLFFKIFSKIVHIIIACIVLILFIISGIVLLTYFDYKDLNENIMNSPILILLQDNQEGNYLAGGTYILEGEGKDQNPIDVSNLLDKQYDEIIGDNYKLIIVNTLFLDKNMDFDIDYGEYTFNKDKVLSLLRSEDPYQTLSNYISKKDVERVKIDQPDPNMLKFQIFSQVLFEIINTKGKEVILEGYKSGDIIVYKNTIFFKIFKYLPYN